MQTGASGPAETPRWETRAGARAHTARTRREWASALRAPTLLDPRRPSARARRLLGLRGLRGALLQIAPRWLLEFWVGTLPLGSLVLVWDQLLRCAATQGTPSTLNLQVRRPRRL